MAVVERHGLTGRLIEIGRQATRTVLDLFQTIPPGDKRLQRLNLIAQDEAARYQAILTRNADLTAEDITGDDRACYSPSPSSSRRHISVWACSTRKRGP